MEGIQKESRPFGYNLLLVDGFFLLDRRQGRLEPFGFSDTLDEKW